MAGRETRVGIGLSDLPAIAVEILRSWQGWAAIVAVIALLAIAPQPWNFAAGLAVGALLVQPSIRRLAVRRAVVFEAGKHSPSSGNDASPAEGRIFKMGCQLRGDRDPFPKRWRNGYLFVGDDEMEWVSYWPPSQSRKLRFKWPLASAQVEAVRAVDRSLDGWNIKSNVFAVLELTFDSAHVRLGVAREAANAFAQRLGTGPP
jgi:hypothetical protein